jgi:hypothetical protein
MLKDHVMKEMYHGPVFCYQIKEDAMEGGYKAITITAELLYRNPKEENTC